LIHAQSWQLPKEGSQTIKPHKLLSKPCASYQQLPQSSQPGAFLLGPAANEALGISSESSGTVSSAVLGCTQDWRNNNFHNYFSLLFVCNKNISVQFFSGTLRNSIAREMECPVAL
jgi:hypothetical protein